MLAHNVADGSGDSARRIGESVQRVTIDEQAAQRELHELAANLQGGHSVMHLKPRPRPLRRNSWTR